MSSSGQSRLTASQSRKLREQFVQMLEIRLFEEKILPDFPTGKLFGTTHTGIGQEANAVGILSAARRNDVVSHHHRPRHAPQPGAPSQLIFEQVGIQIPAAPVCIDKHGNCLEV